jgi:hypothetical protein
MLKKIIFLKNTLYTYLCDEKIINFECDARETPLIASSTVIVFLDTRMRRTHMMKRGKRPYPNGPILKDTRASSIDSGCPP